MATVFVKDAEYHNVYQKNELVLADNGGAVGREVDVKLIDGSKPILQKEAVGIRRTMVELEAVMSNIGMVIEKRKLWVGAGCG